MKNKRTDSISGDSFEHIHKKYESTCFCTKHAGDIRCACIAAAFFANINFVNKLAKDVSSLDTTKCISYKKADDSKHHIPPENYGLVLVFVSCNKVQWRARESKCLANLVFNIAFI